MIAGKLRHRVEIQHATATADAQGGQTKTWATVDRAWASIEPLGSRDRFWTSQMPVWCTHNVTMRYSPNITPQSRILLGSRVLNIVTWTNVDERNKELRLLCAEEL